MNLLILNDNTKYNLQAMNRKAVLMEDGEGMPEIEYITQRGPYQHGETLLDYRLRPRVMQLHLWQKFCDADAYWAGRTALLQALSPLKSPQTLRKLFPNGTKRDISVVIQQGPKFEARNAAFAINEVIRLVAYDPIWYDPTEYSVLFTDDDAELVFPIDFPIVFSDSTAMATVTVAGNWNTFPRFSITGPLDGVIIENITTKETIQINAAIVAGEAIFVNLAYGYKTVMKNDGTNLIGYVTSDSDLAKFHLQPGANDLHVYGSDPGIGTSVTMYWYNRYIGV